jgi:arylsulfatase A-like enzyme
MLDYAGVTRPDYMQGASFRPILDTGHESTEWKKGAYYQYWMHMAHHDVPGHIALRTKRYKLILFHGAGGDPEWSDRSAQRTPPAWELYDLQNDPHETDNLVDDPAYAGVLQGLKAQLKELRADIRADDASTLPAGPNRDRAQLVNNVIDEYWHDTPANRRNAAKLSTAYLQSHGADDPFYIPPWLRLDDLDPSEK